MTSGPIDVDVLAKQVRTGLWSNNATWRRDGEGALNILVAALADARLAKDDQLRHAHQVYELLVEEKRQRRELEEVLLAISKGDFDSEHITVQEFAARSVARAGSKA